MSNIVYSWKFDDKKNRSQLWYIIAFSVVIWLAIWWFLTKQYGMSFIILLLTGLILFVENNSEDTVEVQISDMWIYVGNTFYDYESIEKYATGYRWDSADFIRLYLKKRWVAVLDLKTNNEIIGHIHSTLDQFVENSGKAELSQSDKIIRFLNL